jgi:hypothetical protein
MKHSPSGGSTAVHAPQTLTATQQALQAIATLRSLPNWDEVSDVYGDIGEHLGDLADDLTRADWEELLVVEA